MAYEQLPPTIVGLSFGPTGLSVTAVGGAAATISATNILAYQAALLGPCGILKKQTVERWLATSIADAIGWSNIDPSRVYVTYNMTTGAVTMLQLF